MTLSNDGRQGHRTACCRHERQSFGCGVANLNDFLEVHARQNAEEDISRTYVAICPPSLQLLGFYSICGGSVEREDMPVAAAKRLPRYPIPVVNLAPLAVRASRRRDWAAVSSLMPGGESSDSPMKSESER